MAHRENGGRRSAAPVRSRVAGRAAPRHAGTAAMPAPPRPDGRRGASGRRPVAPPRRSRRHRHRGSGGSPFARAASTVLVALVMGTGAFLGVKLSRTEPASSSEPPASEAYTDAQGHTYLWRKIAPAPAGKIYWGAFRLGAPYNTSLVTGLENEVGRRPAVLMWYQEWAGRQDFPIAEAAWLFDRGIVPMVTWEPWNPPAVFGTIVNEQPEYSLKRIADGAWDGYIEKYARQIKAYGGPVMLRPMHEMDGFWYPWSGTVQVQAGNSPAEYVKAWRHIWNVFRRVGATNVTWVWSVNHVSVPDTPGNQIQNYWPGPKYVDWIGFSGFNWGTASPYSVWKGFDGVELQRYKQLLPFHKPIALTEMGAPEVGGDKASWIHDSFRVIFDHYPRLKMVVWYDKQDTPARQWQIDSSPESLKAFRKEIRNPRVLEASAAQATATPNAGGKP